MSHIVLASGSPRRRELLEILGLSYDVRPANIDETPQPNEVATAYVERLAREKAATAAADAPGGSDHTVVVAADTSVVVDGEILGKPADRADGTAMLRRLSGRSHDVLTGVAVRVGDRTESLVDRTGVEFVDLTAADIDRYLATDEPWDKAGAYGMQGAGGLFVQRIDGSPSNVIGLPLVGLRTLFARHDLELLDHV